VAVITGGAGGIGKATGGLLAARGMKVVLADIEAAALESAVDEFIDQSLDVFGVVTDITDFASVARLRDQALDRYGKVHVAFLNAGVAGFGRGSMWELDLKGLGLGIGRERVGRDPRRQGPPTGDDRSAGGGPRRHHVVFGGGHRPDAERAASTT